VSGGFSTGNAISCPDAAVHSFPNSGCRRGVDSGGSDRQTICDKKGDEMKYVISWNERPQGSPAAPANFKIEFFRQ
jgi:hypothetical protein